ncbi:MAG: hypothetical protein BWY71_01090 [Planctomycetes bacterium ADurb.Bin412]|nr:MAG: hypothetical protein BWY71_01090 [Planctomycetes bacterium ADurb.Bin412]
MAEEFRQAKGGAGEIFPVGMLDLIDLFIKGDIPDAVIGAEIDHFYAGGQQFGDEGHGHLVGQAAEGDIGTAGQLVQIDRLNRQVEPALEGGKDLRQGGAFLGQGGQVGDLGLGMAQEDQDGFMGGIAGGPDNGNSYHGFGLCLKNNY